MKLRTRIPTRARTRGSLLDLLPEEVVLLILKRFTANELMCLRMVGILSMNFFLQGKIYSTCFFIDDKICATVGKSLFAWTRYSVNR